MATITPRPLMRGIGTGPAWLAWLAAAYRPLHAAGLSDTAAAAALAVGRTAVSRTRARLGLPPNAGNLCPADAPRRAEHARRVGRANAGRRAHDAAAYGLPADLYAMQVRVVIALAGGPATRVALAAACGTTVNAMATCGSRGRCHWLRDLRGRGLIASTPPAGRTPILYFLTGAAIAALSTTGTESPNGHD